MSKTMQLSGDVYLAMRSRGFQGEVYLLDEFQTDWFDWARAERIHHNRVSGFLVWTMRTVSAPGNSRTDCEEEKL